MDLKKRLIIAEIGMTHDGSLGQAIELTKTAAIAGVDAVKYQLHISAAETIRNAPQPPYFKAEPRYDFFERTAFKKEQWIQIKEVCMECGVYFIVSPFSIEAVQILEEIGVDAIKIPSGEITNIPYLEYIAHTQIPVIISSGMSSWKELNECIKIFEKQGCNYAILQCTSEYPCPPTNIGLNIIDELKEIYPNCAVGLSDHSEGIWASLAAWMKGATIIEKHFTLSKLMYGPDAKISMEPQEMRQLCDSIKNLEIALKSPVDKNDCIQYSDMKSIFQKSIVAIKEIKAGTILTADMLGYKKPGTGLETKYYKDIIGKRVKRDLAFDDILYKGDIEW